MATSRSRGTKRDKKRRKKRNSRTPALFLIAAMAAAGGLLVVSAQQSATPASVDEGSSDTAVALDSMPAQPIAPATDAPVVTIGSVAPPVSVDTDDDNGDGDDGLVLDDFTPTETPQPPASPLTVPASAISNGTIGGPLADGYYIGFLDGTESDDSIVVRFDSESGPVFEVPLDDLLFVSLRVDARDPSHPGNAVVSARTLRQLLERDDETYTIPDTDDLVLVDGTFLITIADGRLVGIEALG
jgi:hypothetical protein